jgi:hypothetical protein
MTHPTDIALQRLCAERLLGEPFDTTEAAVHSLVAVQAQDFPGAKWAVGQRVGHATDASIQEAFQSGRLLRTHTMRPTWHFVLPEDIRWLLKLTSPRVHQASSYYYRKLALDHAAFARSHEIIAKMLQGGKQLTRNELSQELQAAGVSGPALRIGLVMMHAELEGLICSGAMRGKQHTYALLEERVPKGKSFEPEAALAELTQRYFTGHGPAQAQDFAWWSGLTLSQVKQGLELASTHLLNETIDGKQYWFAHAWPAPQPTKPVIHLLPNYDESVIAYKDRSAYLDPNWPKIDVHLLFNHILLRNGGVIGGWRRLPGKNGVTVELRLPRKLDTVDDHALRQAVARFQAFLNVPVTVTWR